MCDNIVRVFIFKNGKAQERDESIIRKIYFRYDFILKVYLTSYGFVSFLAPPCVSLALLLRIYTLHGERERKRHGLLLFAKKKNKNKTKHKRQRRKIEKLSLSLLVPLSPLQVFLLAAHKFQRITTLREKKTVLCLWIYVILLINK